MKILLVLLMLACGGSPWIPLPHPNATNEWSAVVTGKLDCINWQDRRCAPYKRLEDESWIVGIHFLYNYELACLVSGEDITMVRIGDSYSCKWRHPRSV